MLKTPQCGIRLTARLCTAHRLLPLVLNKHLSTSVTRSSHILSPHVKFNGQPKLHGIILRHFASSALPAHKDLGMPALSPTMSQGNIAQWKKKEGDKISAGDIIAEIETDKATIDFEAQDDGYLAKIIAPSGSKDIPINQTIAIIVDNKADVEKFKNYSGEKATPPKEESKDIKSESTKSSGGTQQPKQPSGPKKEYPPHITIGMPALSPTMEKGNIVKWKKQAGEKIKVGESIAEIETDKATIDFESQEDGFMAKILVPEGTHDVAINSPVAIIVDKQQDVAKFTDYEASPTAKQEPQEAPKTVTPQKESARSEGAPVSPKASLSGGRVIASPLAKSIANEKGIDIASISGTGPDNRIIKADVLEFAASHAHVKKEKEAPTIAAQPKAQPVSGEFTDLPVSNIRKVTAQRLLLSKQTIPHYYLSIEANVDQLLKLRTDLNAQANGKYKLSVNDFIVKASALAMHKVPAVNSSWNDQFIRRYHNVDINVAVNTDQGLFTPIVKDADKKGLAAIANTVKSLAEKAKDNKLQPGEFQGGTFTISNLGMFGIKHFSAVINPPQAAILAVGGVEKRVVQRDVEGEQQFTVASILSVTLSCDHRVVDGAVGAEWLQAFKDYVENPIKMLL